MSYISHETKIMLALTRNKPLGKINEKHLLASRTIMSEDKSHDSNMDDVNSVASSNSFDHLPKKFECEICSRKFTTHFNLLRHIKTVHDDDSESDLSDTSEDERKEDMSESSSDEDMSEDGSSDEDMSEEESSSDESSSDDEIIVPNMFRKLVAEVWEEHEEELTPITNNYMSNNMSEKEAMIKAIQNSTDAKKTLRHLFINNIVEVEQQRRHPLYKAIMRKAKELMDDGLGECEALTSAVTYRKHAIYNLLNFI